jgi:hypothetical protein
MRSLIQEMKERFHEIEAASCEDCNRPKDKCVCKEEPVEEQNVTGALDGGAGPVKTPFAFSKKPNKKTAEQLGYKLVQEAMDAKYEKLIEGYRDYVKHGNKKPSRHINDSIKEIAKKLQEIETVVSHTTRFKNESGVASSQYGPSASKALAKIAERLTKISERVRALGE